MQSSTQNPFPLTMWIHGTICAMARPLISLLFTVAGFQVMTAPARGAENIILYPPVLVNTPRWLEKRHQEQVTAAKGYQAFHDFQFTDQTAASGINFEQRSVNDAGKYWKPAHYDHGTGVAVADVDGDGKLDIYFVNQLGANQLWRNLGGGKFEDITASAGVALQGRIHVGASFADVDNDGDSDLAVTTVKMGNVLFENLGNGKFRDVSKLAGVDYSGHSSTALFLDFDNDGLLDLYVANIGVYTSDERGEGGFFLSITNAFRGHTHPERTERSILYRNLGGLKFKDISKEVNLPDAGWSGEATFVDLNQDRFPDIYAANMQGDNHYFENVQGKSFVDKTATYFPKTPWGAMGAKFFDFNQDGLMDLFVTDMHSDMTELQTKEGRANTGAKFEKAKSEQWCTVFWTDAFLQGASNNIFGNAFYMNQGGGSFSEVSDKIGAETYWPWGFSVGDLNADSFEDAFVTAGMGYPFRYAINSVLLNEAGRRFHEAEFVLGVEPRSGGRFSRPMFTFDCSGADKSHQFCNGQSGLLTISGSLSSRSSVLFDLDDDGDLDIVTNEMNDRPQVLVSNLADKKSIRFLKVKLVGAKSNRDGFGATVTVHAGAKKLTQYNDGKSGYLSQSPLPLYFGLGELAQADKVEVQWPSGTRQMLAKDIPKNGLLTIKESGE